MKQFNVVLTTVGRDTLQRMVDSIAPQLKRWDYLTILWDCQPIALQINSKCQVISLLNPEPLGYWGHASRTKWQSMLPGDYLMNGDDDDVFLPGAMDKIREVCTEEKLYVFKMIYAEHEIWKTQVIDLGNIGTPCGVYPPKNLPSWDLTYGGDCQFYKKLSTQLPVQFVDHIIYEVKP